MSLRAAAIAAALLALVTLPAPVHAQAADAERLAVAKDLMQVAGVAKQFDEVMPYLTQQLAQSFVAIAPDKAGEIREVFSQLAVKFVDRKGELIDQITALYAEKLTLEDLRAIVAFYKSPAGVRFITAQPDIMRQSMTLGQRWGQSTVLAWELKVESEQATATLPLPGGTAGLNEVVFEALAKELTDGGHIRYAGPDSLVFVAHTGDDSDDQFKARMAQAKTILEAAGVRTGNLTFAQADMTAITRDSYQRFIDGAVRGKAA